MKKKEFIEKFRDGKTKIRRDPWARGVWIIPSCFGLEDFGGITERDTCRSYFYDKYWEPYKEPAPEFDWDKEYMWGKAKVEGGVNLMVKTSFMTWDAIDCEADWLTSYSKKQILEHYEPSTAPDNYKDYGIEELK